MLKLKKYFIISIILFMVFSFTTGAFAESLYLGENPIDVPTNWEIVDQENKTDYYEDFPFIESLNNFSLLLIKTDKIDEFEKARVNNDNQKLLESYPAYILIRQIEINKENREEVLMKPVNQMIKQVNATYENANISKNEKIDVGEYPAHSLHYEAGHMEFRNLFFFDETHLMVVLSTNTRQQEAKYKIDTFYNDLIQASK